MPRKIDLTNQKFGRLTVIQPCENIKGRTAWLCRCDCGKEIKVITKSLRDGNTKSCGCLHKEIVSKQFAKNLTGQKFGKLTAIQPTNKRKHGSVIWECQCECGNKHLVSAEVLLSGKSNSCGCLQSKGNAKIKDILQQNNILFISEYPIRIDGINYYFDFAILNENNSIKCFIEYDGILHYSYDTNHGWNNKENWEKTYKNDLIKNNYANSNNILLIRIPYTDFDKIDINYLKERIR